MVVVFGNIGSLQRAIAKFQELIRFNRGTKSRTFRYIYLRRLKSGKFQVGLTEKKPKFKARNLFKLF